MGKLKSQALYGVNTSKNCGSHKAQASDRVFTSRDFLDIAPRKQVTRILSGLVKKGIIMRPYRGVYHRPKMSVFGLVPANIREVIQAILPNERLFFSDLRSANMLGLSTQMQVRIAFTTRKTTREIYLADGNIITLTAAEIPLFDHISDHANVAIQGIYCTGKYDMHEMYDWNIQKCANRLSDEDIKDLKKLFTHLPDWMHTVILDIESFKKAPPIYEED